MEKLHARSSTAACASRDDRGDAEELFRQVAAFASFGFAKSHAAAFARTAYESSFLKLFYPAQFIVGLINAQPMGFYPVEVLVNDAKRHGVAVLPVDINALHLPDDDRMGRGGRAGRSGTGDDGPGEPLPEDAGIERRPAPVRSSACIDPVRRGPPAWAAESAVGWGVRLGLRLVKGIGEEHKELLDAELARGPYRSPRRRRRADRAARGDDRAADPGRGAGLAGSAAARAPVAAARGQRRVTRRVTARWPRDAAAGRSNRAAGRPMDLRLPATDAPTLPAITESERIGDAYAVIGLDARRQVVGLFRPALDRLGAVTNAALEDRAPGQVRIGGLVVTRQHPMTAKGTVFLALEDETGMVNVTLWPDTWARLRGVVRRHALLLVDGDLQRESSVVNVIARDVRPLVEVAATAGGPDRPDGVRQLG